MKLKGTQTEVRQVEVEVSPRELVDAVGILVAKRYPKFDSNNYVASDGFWRLFDYVDHHKGTDEFKRGEKATEEDLKVAEFLKMLNEICWSQK